MLNKKNILMTEDSVDQLHKQELKIFDLAERELENDINRENLKFYSTQDIGDFEKEAILQVLSSDYLARGPKIQEFEGLLGEICNGNSALAVNSATSALHVAYKVANVHSDSLIWTTPITFVATANAAIQLGAKIDFVDIDPKTLNICPEILEEKLRNASRQNNLPDVITVVHFAGNPCDMDKIYDLSEIYGFKVIEDASHALGSRYNNLPIGGDNRSEATIFSFHPVKMITTGEGGALILSSKKNWKRASILRNHGIVHSEKKNKNENWFYEQLELGNNYHMTEIGAAMGIVQLARLSHFVKKRNFLASLYKQNLVSLPIEFQKISEKSLSSYHLFTIQSSAKVFDRNKLYGFLSDSGIASQVHYIPVYHHPFYKSLGFKKQYCPNAESYFRRCLSIPLHQKLEEEDIHYVVHHLKKYFE